MKEKRIAKFWKPAVMALAVLLGFAAAATSGELQQVVLMAAAVTAALVCFDSALNRRNRSLIPWMLLCASVLAKVIPSVRFGLASPDTLLFERWDHLGTVASSFWLMAALTSISILHRSTSVVDRARVVSLVSLAAVASGAAGATLGYSYDPGFGSEAAARIFETLGWAFAGGVIVAALAAMVRASRPSGSLAIVASFAAVTAALAAWSTAGRTIDVGWWALSWALLVIAGLAFNRARLLGPARISQHSLQAVAGGAALLALIGVVASFVTDATWSLGWIVLLLAAIGFCGLAATQGSAPENANQEATDQAFIGAIEAERSEPVGDLLAFPATDDDEQFVAHVPDAQEPFAPQPAFAAQDPGAVPVAGYAPPVDAGSVPVAGYAPPANPGAVPAAGYAPPANPVPAAGYAPPAHPVPVAGYAPPANPGAVPAAGYAPPANVQPAPAFQEPIMTPQGMPQTPAPEPAVPAPPPYSYAANTRQRRLSASDLTDALAPRHYDPPTMLLSNAGLQEVVLRAFAEPEHAENETALLFIALRNGSEIEAEHGRVVIDDVIRQLANRLRAGLPDAVCARFAPAAFAALLVGNTPPNDQVVERSTRTLLRMLNDVSSNGVAVQVDVVGGLAQCRDSESADSLVARANDGLERAVTSPEPTLVAMP